MIKSIKMFNLSFKSVVLAFCFIVFFTACNSKLETYQDQDPILNCAKLTTKISETMESSNDSLFIKKIFLEDNQVNNDRFIRLINLKLSNGCNLNDKELNFISKNLNLLKIKKGL